MTTDKDLKRLVRARMKKTGEAYTAARAQVTRKKTTRTRTTAAKAAASDANTDYAALAGMSDAVIKQKTGCDWSRWIKSLDYHGAAEMSHGDIARIVRDTYHVTDWWTQAVTVGYERIKGLRARGQRRNGTYEASKSRTFNVPVGKLFDAWNESAIRRKWLDEPGINVRTANRGKSMRLGWSDGSIISLYFLPKGDSKSSVAVQHTKLPTSEAATALKKYWSERLDALADVLAK
jgi:hypothetical protein